MTTACIGRLLAGLLLSCWASDALAQTTPRILKHSTPNGMRVYKLKVKKAASTEAGVAELPPLHKQVLPLPDSARHVDVVRSHEVSRDRRVAAHASPAATGFPWPPRPYSEQVNLKKSFFAGMRTLGDADAHLTDVLSQAGYHNFRYYPLPQQPGYALVTKFEQIKGSYEPMPGAARWSLSTTPCPNFSLYCVAHSLIFPTNGYWRVFVFVITDRPLPAPVGDSPDWEEGQGWFEEGSNLLPTALRDEPFTARHYGAVLVYEFCKKEGQDVVMLSRCRLDGFAQLQLAGIRY